MKTGRRPLVWHQEAVGAISAMSWWRNRESQGLDREGWVMRQPRDPSPWWKEGTAKSAPSAVTGSGAAGLELLPVWLSFSPRFSTSCCHQSPPGTHRGAGRGEERARGSRGAAGKGGEQGRGEAQAGLAAGGAAGVQNPLEAEAAASECRREKAREMQGGGCSRRGSRRGSWALAALGPGCSPGSVGPDHRPLNL